jgi:hypothetical protein
VSRLGCNNGVTGTVLAPDVQSRPDSVIVTFRVVVAPNHSGIANCQSNNWVRYDVKLGEPVAARVILDGQCLFDGEAERTGFCQPNALRWSP